MSSGRPMTIQSRMSQADKEMLNLKNEEQIKIVTEQVVSSTINQE